MRDVSSTIPLETIDIALDVLSDYQIDDDVIRPTIAGIVESLIINLRMEEAPDQTHQRRAINEVLEPLRLVNAAIIRLDEASIRVLAAASLRTQAWPLDDGLNDGRIKIGNGTDALADMIDWCERATAELKATPKMGRPREEALFDGVCELAEVFRDITGKRPTRNIQSQSAGNAQSFDTTEKGGFRQFANALLGALNITVSDDMAKRVVAKLRVEEKSKKIG